MGNRPDIQHSRNYLFRREMDYDMPLVVELKYYVMKSNNILPMKLFLNPIFLKCKALTLGL